MPGLGGGKRSAARQPAQAKGKKGKKRVSGNPAKAAQQKAALESAAKEKSAHPFGDPDGAQVDYEKAAEQLNLPKDFSQFLK
jgi:signal recognition particle subunit SRP54